ncbi:Receptor-type guanylate cyclase gcy [Seminavis robusta]|uniref:Receptor-type guanylate cyclase gcy n=1 Tax=Seminavis robusta TaxID=568900 RepID=A0A9N8EI31_9STRA|nr:Receptor-type guanylate cyclase gcy [Seminavis robusta]|eukprot:Sro1200_g251840.1 Receptor-type guanylate cyclase gcy (801) ;mRNA; f:8153-11883
MAERVESDDSSMSIFLDDIEGMDDTCIFDDIIPEEEENCLEDPGEQRKFKLATKETRNVLILRIAVSFVLLCGALGISLTVFRYSRENEKQAFEQAFADSSRKLVDHFLLNAKRRVDAINNLATAITSHALSSPDRWPFVTIPNWERRVTGVLDQAQIISLTLMPIVTNETRPMWETYSVYKQEWFLESMTVRREEQVALKGEDTVARDEAESLTALEAVGDGLDKTFRINPSIYRIDGLNAAPETTDGPYLPVWQFAPSIPISDVVNFNTLSHPSYALEAASCMAHQTTVIGRAFDFSNETNPEVAGRKAFLNLFLNRWRNGGNDYEDGPVSDLYLPIFNDFSKDKTIVGVLLANVYWQIYFSDVLAENAHGVVAVLENQCLGPPSQSFTYIIHGEKARYVGAGDLHDVQYDYLEAETGFGAFLPGEGREGIDYNCIYNVRVYPSNEMQRGFFTNTPYVFAGSVLVVFVFTSLIFLTYDRCVQRRQRVLKKTAEDSNEVLASFFPPIVRERLFGPQTSATLSDSSTTRRSSSTAMSKSLTRRSSTSFSVSNKHTKRRQSSMPELSPSYDLEEVVVDDSLPIADLYENCTVFFADIAGFTAWSSKRQPGEVFKLLETLYGSFDRAAKRMGVFKVETIGDCYLCVTGLPSPQVLHAVIMSRFSARCLVEMTQVCNKLVALLGEETATLGLRIGLHSGPVTAGVLRNDKSRYQLFGDTVNTAARMESNGQKGRIQISQQTADLLREAGKGDWARPRKGQIEAKGQDLEILLPFLLLSIQVGDAPCNSFHIRSSNDIQLEYTI